MKREKTIAENKGYTQASVYFLFNGDGELFENIVYRSRDRVDTRLGWIAKKFPDVYALEFVCSAKDKNAKRIKEAATTP